MIPPSPHLPAERQRLLDAIATIRDSGSVAPAYCWLTESSETKRGKTYTYVRLVTEKPGQKNTSTSLGRPGSSKHRAWQAAIARREAINELEQQLKLLEALMQRQAEAMQWLKVMLEPSQPLQESMQE